MRFLTILLGLGFCYLIHLLLRNRRLRTTKSRLIALALVWTMFRSQRRDEERLREPEGVHPVQRLPPAPK